MSEYAFLAILGALQAVSLGYLEYLRRTKCGSPTCIRHIEAILGKERR